jgi:hypothetical protein
MANKMREKPQRFLDNKEKKQFLKELELLFINVDFQKKEISQKTLEIENAKKINRRKY